MSFSRYPGYKDSGVEWLGEVPEHWVVTTVRRLVTIRKRIAGELGYDVLSITQQGIRVRDLESNDGQLSMDYSKYQIVEIGDFAMNHMDLLTGWVDVASHRGVTSPDYRVFSVRNAEDCYRPFLLFLFQNAYKNRIFYAYGQGSSHLGRWRLPTDAFNDFALPLPPQGEQKAIVAFLDGETAKIDALIAEQQRLIELLKEKRQAVISHAVTRGLNPDASMKPSGVEWLGDVPAHWEVTQLRRIIRKGSTITYGIVQAGPHVEDGVPYIKTSDMSGPDLPTDGYSRTAPEIDAAYARSRVEAGDLVIAIRASVGKCLRVPPSLAGANLTQGTAKIAPGDRVSGEVLLTYINSTPVQAYLDSKAKGATFKEITLDALRRTPVLVPPAVEQHAISQTVAEINRTFGQLIADAERAITLLQERRTALISAAVTGKIDVRGIAPAEAA